MSYNILHFFDKKQKKMYLSLNKFKTFPYEIKNNEDRLIIFEYINKGQLKKIKKHFKYLNLIFYVYAVCY